MIDRDAEILDEGDFLTVDLLQIALEQRTLFLVGGGVGVGDVVGDDIHLVAQCRVQREHQLDGTFHVIVPYHCAEPLACFRTAWRNSRCTRRANAKIQG